MRFFGGSLADTDKMRKANAIVMALAFIMLFGAASAALTLSQRASANIDDAVEALRIRSELKEIMSLVQDAEIGQRGFLLTRDTQYLEPYNASRLLIDRRLAQLETLVEPGTDQAIRFEQLHSATRRRLQEADTTIALGREGRFSEALTIISRDQGKALMDEIRDIVQEARAAENARHEERVAKMLEARVLLSTSLIGALLAALVLAFLSIQLTRRQFATMTSSRNQLITLNEELEARVRERTQELEIARERAEAETNRAEYERGRVELLLREVTHRVGNNLAMVSSLLRMQQAKLEDGAARSAIETARGRIQTISTAQRRLRLGDDLQSTRVDGFWTLWFQISPIRGLMARPSPFPATSNRLSCHPVTLQHLRLCSVSLYQMPSSMLLKVAAAAISGQASPHARMARLTCRLRMTASALRLRTTPRRMRALAR